MARESGPAHLVTCLLILPLFIRVSCILVLFILILLNASVQILSFSCNAIELESDARSTRLLIATAHLHDHTVLACDGRSWQLTSIIRISGSMKSYMAKECVFATKFCKAQWARERLL